MAQEPDPLTPGRPAFAGTGGGASDATYSAQGKDADEIQDDIRHTRAEMSETVQALEARFQPEYIKEQAKDAIRSTARDAGNSMLDTIKANPVPAILAGLSIGWLIAKGGDTDRDRSDRDRYDQDYYRQYGRYPEADQGGGATYGAYRQQGYSQQAYGYTGYGQQGYSQQGTAEGLAAQAGGLADEARAKAGDVADAASDAAHRATDQLQEWGHDAQHVAQDYGRRATNWLEHQIDANPLAVGAVALAAGALVGLAVPGTDRENELLGEKSAQLKRQASQAVGEKVDQLKETVDELAPEAKEKARDLADSAKDKADQKGLTDAPRASAGSPAGAGSALSGARPAGGGAGTSGSGGAPSGSGGTSGTPSGSGGQAPR